MVTAYCREGFWVTFEKDPLPPRPSSVMPSSELRPSIVMLPPDTPPLFARSL